MSLKPPLESTSCPCKLLPLCLSSFTSAEYGDVHGLARRGGGGAADGLARRVDPATGETPLHLAAQHGQVAAAALLLRAGCPADGAAESRCTPLHRASFSGAVGTMRLLLEAPGCDLLAVDRSFGDRMTPLHKAAAGGRFLAVQLLLEALEDRGLRREAVAAADASGKTPLQVAEDRLSQGEEAMASVARWNQVAGGRPDFGKCVQLLKAPTVRSTKRTLFTVSTDDCLQCGDDSCRTASWEMAFRTALSMSAQEALSTVASRNQLPISTSLQPEAGHNAVIPTSGNRILQEEKSMLMSQELQSIGHDCDACGVRCAVVFQRQGKLVCRGCRNISRRPV